MPDLQVIERRIYATEFREVPGSEGRQRWARAVTYGTVDDYGTAWRAGCFNAALGERMPTILYGHDWWTLEHVLGQGADFRDVTTADDFGPPGCDVLIEFADPAEVDAARLAMALTRQPNPVLRDVSVGFDRREWVRKDDLSADLLALGAEEEMVEAAMDELSIVVRGAVPGAQMRSRSFVIDGHVAVDERAPTLDDHLVSANGEQTDLQRAIADGDLVTAHGLVVADLTEHGIVDGSGETPPPTERTAPGVPLDAVLDLARRKASGEITDVEARAALDLLDGRTVTPDPAAEGTATVPAAGAEVREPSTPAPASVDDAEALALADRARRR